MTAPKPRLSDVEAKAAAATEGPWVIRGGPASDLNVTSREGRFVANMGDPHYDGTRADASFIADARTTIPALTAAIRAVEDALPNHDTLLAADASHGLYAKRYAALARKVRASLSAHIDLTGADS